MSRIRIPAPVLQVDFSSELERIRGKYLQDALSETVERMDLSMLDRELADYVPRAVLKTLEKHGLRGEFLFPVPCLFEVNPFLLGYYRLLLGFSQKAFYATELGVSEFRSMEEKGRLSKTQKAGLPNLCKGLVDAAAALLDGIGADQVNRRLLADLTLLTLGPQLRGGANVKKGIAGIMEVFQVIRDIVAHAVTDSSAGKIVVGNAAGRMVSIEFAPDPDIVVKEAMSKGKFRNIVAVEVKGGTDFSNIHNRIGEAEKSHQKARNAGYVEFWTVVNVDKIDLDTAGKESPTTNRFYRLSDLKSGRGDEYEDFKERVVALTGVRRN